VDWALPCFGFLWQRLPHHISPADAGRFIFRFILFTVEMPRDCYDILVNMGKDTSGEYSVFSPKNEVEKKVWCDMKTLGGGWTVCITKYVLL